MNNRDLQIHMSLEHVDVKSAKLEKGMLNVHLVREVPEELKPKTIDIVEAE